MKNLFKAFAFTALLGAAFTSCDSDPCKDVVCGEGTCVEGICECNFGFEKDSSSACTVEYTAKFLNNGQETVYVGDDVCTDGDFTWNATFRRVSATQLNIINFGGYGATEIVPATVVKANAGDATATRIEVSYTDPAGRTFLGDGTIAGDIISFNYSTTFNDGTSASCTTTLTRQ